MLCSSSAISATTLRQENDILHNTGFQVQINGVGAILFRFLTSKL